MNHRAPMVPVLGTRSERRQRLKLLVMQRMLEGLTATQIGLRLGISHAYALELMKEAKMEVGA